MAEPARVHQLHDPNLMDPQKAAVLLQRLEALVEETEVLKDALKTERRKRVHAQRELNDMLAEYADAEEVTTFLKWWRDYTKRGPHTDTSANTERAKSYRKLRKKWTTREVALMVTAAMNDPWRVKKGLTDLCDLEKRADWLLQEAIRIRGGRA